MTARSTTSAACLAAFTAFGFASPADAQCKSSSERAQTASLASFDTTPDIVDTAIAAGSFQTLVAAVQAADLVDALRGDGPFTVFAPTDEAFARLPKGTIAMLLQPENKALLTSILTYHVVPGALNASDVTGRSGAPSLNGQGLAFKADEKGVFVDGAMVIKTDIVCGNGVIHVIDAVVMPSDQNIVQVAQSTGMFDTLLAAATTAGLAEALMGEGPFTVLAPTDDAFAKLPDGTVETLLKPENRDQLVAILKYHVIPTRAFAADAAKAGRAATLLGPNVKFTKRNNTLYADNARIVMTDVNASNGVVHVIDTVIMPPAGT